MEENNIYSYVNAYNTFLKFEQLGTESQSYTPYEVTIYITSDLKSHPSNSFDEGIDHVRHQLQLYQYGISVPKGIEIGKIIKTNLINSFIFQLSFYCER